MIGLFAGLLSFIALFVLTTWQTAALVAVPLGVVVAAIFTSWSWLAGKK